MTASLIYYRDLVWTLVGKELKVRYKSTFLGYLWSILNPLAFAVVYFFAFSVVMRFDYRKPILFLIGGVFPWQWFANSVGASNSFFLGNASLIKKVRFPRVFLVVAGVMNDSVHFLISIPVIMLVMLYYKTYPNGNWLWAMPLLFFIQVLLTTGMCLIMATANLFFRDLERLTGVLVMLWMYVTPVVYPDYYLTKNNLRWVLLINPMAPLVDSWRQLFMNEPFDAALLAAGVVWSVVIFALGYVTYRAREPRFAEIV